MTQGNTDPQKKKTAQETDRLTNVKTETGRHIQLERTDGQTDKQTDQQKWAN